MTTPAATAPPDKRGLRTAYAFGLFSMALIDVFVFLIPIYAGVTLGMSDGEIGALVGARAILSLFLSIHGGALMDRLGVRRISLIYAGIVVLCGPLFPLLPNFHALLVLQIISGFAISMSWTGAQILIARVAEGDAEYIGRFSTFSRIGTTVAPVIAGALFDLGGAWLAYGFGTVWAIFAFAAIWAAPEPDIVTETPPRADTPESTARPAFRLRDLLPRPSDYAASFALMAIPAVALTAIAMLVRNSSYGIQTSVYMTYAQGIGFSATAIGFLFAAIEMSAGLGSWFSGRAMRRYDARWVLILSTMATITLVCATPIYGWMTPTMWVIYACLIVAQIVRGAIQGVSQPILSSVQAKSVGRHQQGSVVGLRQTMNRICGITVPPVIGLASDAFGREESFLVVGAGLLLICCALALYARRVPPISG
jgi:MFS family permease